MRVKLEDVCERGTSSLMQKDIVDKNGKYPVYGASGRIGSMETYQQEHQTVAVVKDGAGIGRTMLLPEKSSVIGTMQYLIPKNCIESEYLYYVVKYMHLEKYFSGATIPHIYFRDYKTEEFNLHDKTEQREIVSTLKRIEAIISNRQEQLTKLDELIKARFVEMFGDLVENPKQFPCVLLGSIMTVMPQNGLYKPQSAYVQDKFGTPILRIDGFYNGKVTDFNNLKRLCCTDFEKERYLLVENDIVINRVNSIEYLGKCARISGLQEDTVFESNMMRFHLDDSKVNSTYITTVLCSQYIYRQILTRAKKAVNQASINQGDVQSLNVVVPPLSLQNQFADFVAEVDKSKVEVQKALDQTHFAGAGCWYTRKGVRQYGRQNREDYQRDGRVPECCADEKAARGAVADVFRIRSAERADFQRGISEAVP